ncbi:MAG TPA: MFS transporter [Actinomycetes bacterium]|nr:MFS transporter [Actinomycetes bacterium]
MPNPYAMLLRIPGAAAFSGSGLVARLPIAMVGIAVVLLIGEETGSYAVAGAVAATTALAEAVISPQAARLIDQYGQRRIGLPQLAIHVLGMLCLVFAVRLDAPRWTYVPAAVLAGFIPNIGSMVRARWRYVLPSGVMLRTAFSLESALDEVAFVVGPPLVTVVAARWSPSAAIVVLVIGFGVGGGLTLLSQRATEPRAAGPAEAGQGSALRHRGMVDLVVVLAFLGGIFGAVEVVTVAWASEAGHPARAGFVLACYAAGSLIAGLTYGVRHPASPLQRQLLVGCWAMAVCTTGFALVTTPVELSAVAFVAGFAIAPTLVVSFSLIERLVPREQLTEGLTWLTTGIVVGISLAAPLAGRAVDAVGPHRAYLVAVASGVLAAVTGTALRGRLTPPATAWPAHTAPEGA